MSNPSLKDRANYLAFDIITVLLDCGDLTAPGTEERLADWLFSRGIAPKRKYPIPIRGEKETT